MPLLHYVRFENLKGFAGEHRVELAHPSVLIGPNNSGKTTVLQALSLWSFGLRAWWGRRQGSNASDRSGTAINRLALTSVPVPSIRVLWHDARIRRGNDRLPLWIEAGVDVGGLPVPIRLAFSYQGPELVYANLDISGGEPGQDALDRAANLRIELLYPLSGLVADEPVLQRGRIDLLLGQGETGQVLRNLCLEVVQGEDGEHRWGEVQRKMKRFFDVELARPLVTAQGGITLHYQQEGVQNPLELLMAGRGFLQLLLVLVYLHARPGAVLLIDEPDAHLEVLRQRQVYVQLRDVAEATASQVILASHSREVLDEALDTSLTHLIEGRVEGLSQKRDVLNSLKHFGTQNYVRARDRGYVLYVEGSTDVDLLRAFAERLEHPALEVWDERVNVYYVQDNYPEASEEEALERVEGGFGVSHLEHFQRLAPLVPGLRGLAVLDNDGRGRRDQQLGSLKVAYWRRYEVENYLISPSLLLRSVAGTMAQGSLFDHQARRLLDDLILDRVFAGEAAEFHTYARTDPAAQGLLWLARTERLKLSVLAEEFYRRLAVMERAPMRYTKGTLHRLVPLMEASEVAAEVSIKLDLLRVLFASGDR